MPAWQPSGSASSRSRLLTKGTGLPTCSASALWVPRPSTSESRRKRLGLLDRVQVLALDVRDQRGRQSVLLVADQDRDLLDAGLLRGPQAALSVDQDEVPVLASHGQRRGDPVLLDRRGASYSSAVSSNSRRGFKPSGTSMSETLTVLVSVLVAIVAPF